MNYISNYNMMLISKERHEDVVRAGINAINQALESVIDYMEVDNYEQADVKILICLDGDSDIGNTPGMLVNQEWNNREIIGSEIYLNSGHMGFNRKGDTITAHEIGHSLSLGHSSNREDLMHSTSSIDLDTWNENMEGDRMILGLLYSLPYGTVNPFVE